MVEAVEDPPARERILVAIDFSEHSRRALSTAAQLADVLGAELIVLHVLHDPVQAPEFYQRDKKAQKKTRKRLKSQKEAAADIMDGFLELARGRDAVVAGLTGPRVVLTHGDPVFRVLEVAREEAASLIVVGSHGRTGPEHLLLGSKAERIVRLSPVTVVVVK